MSVEQSVTEYKLSPGEAIPTATPPCMEDSISDHDKTAPHEQLPSFPRLRDGIDMSDSHLNATITYFCRMVYPHDGVELKMDLEGPSHGYNRSDDEANDCPPHHGEMKEYVINDDRYCHCNTESAAILAAGAVDTRIYGPAEDEDCCCRYSAYNEDPGDDDGRYCQCASDSEDSLYCQCSSNSQASLDEEGSPN